MEHRYGVNLGTIVGLLAVTFPTPAQPRDIHADRQAAISRILSSEPLSYVRAERDTCAQGRQVTWVAQRRAAGLNELPDATELCIASLTRIGRTGALGYIRFPNSSITTVALALDNGFVAGWLKHQSASPQLPSMDALKPYAERCLALSETDSGLCYSVGYAFGVRAANGEIIVAR